MMHKFFCSLFFFGITGIITQTFSAENEILSLAQEPYQESQSHQKNTLPFLIQEQIEINKRHKQQNPDAFPGIQSTSGTGFQQPAGFGARAVANPRGFSGRPGTTSPAGFGAQQQASPKPVENSDSLDFFVNEIPTDSIAGIVSNFKNKICAANKGGKFKFNLKAGIKENSLVIAEKLTEGGLSVIVNCDQ